MEGILGLIGFIIFWYVATFVIGGIGILLEKAGIIDLDSIKSDKNVVDKKEATELESNTKEKNESFSTKNIDDLIKELEITTEKQNDTLANKYTKVSSISTSKKVHILNDNDKILDKYDIKYLYHMTHINNLQNILHYGLLSHDNHLVSNRIDNPAVNNRRNFIEPIYNKNVHNYVPLYFNPKNAMPYVNKENQGDLVILVFDNNLIYEQGSLFTDGNVSVNGTIFYNNINDLDKLAWDCIHAKTWFNFNDGKRTKMSEVLVPNKVGVNKLKKLYCSNYHIKNYIDNLILNYPNIKVEVNTEMFF